ncbi:hypothetical protein GCM10010365_45930 [Streptomyces poonensis]|uniref:Uncharacterized protein n=1 Tax=Streptomyces poonensis TaxID=68255 RepID=A0A918PSF7_9ACTN|nr:hypothetical protein GCM10010365_45930 [Streptomyces poonensis]
MSEYAFAGFEAARGAADDLNLDTADLAGPGDIYRKLIRQETREYFPQSPAEQLRRAVLAVFASRSGERGRLHRWREHIPDDLPEVSVEVRGRRFVVGGTVVEEDTVISVNGAEGRAIPERLRWSIPL